MHILFNLDTAVQKLLNIEEVPQATNMTKDLICKGHFIKTHYREKSGRYEVHLLFKESPFAVNDFYQVVRRFKRVKQALRRQPTLWTMYKDFKHEYEHFNHMKLVQLHEQQPQIYLPYHHVETMKVISYLTKRKLLSKIARNFNPCGWLAPIVIIAKLIMQQLWLLTPFTHSTASNGPAGPGSTVPAKASNVRHNSQQPFQIGMTT
ncbi:Retrotransposon, Pao [Cinara cedri]|uniref:Retrotransposon, Pao n=1 Tax=Cinara cedri TaxID=506608 RepID=A0A5E4MQP3_9HEMI|nr:Retrotransposon, Pao [Cinara cedri]